LFIVVQFPRRLAAVVVHDRRASVRVDKSVDRVDQRLVVALAALRKRPVWIVGGDHLPGPRGR
jgi:hypothetical protein